ncbi:MULTISPECIES: carbohydrate ABC transporter permease [Streptomyces]|uniref:Sugar ABC transporter permease n=1 Tax=Streptomyces griseoaurantiacus TaxID=68213 RepID=A0ABZ1VCM3_9ACTN|nr:MULTISPECIES: sugar ABC transporter permease [Streptomyces]MCF0085202.1 Trehalose transport system permease protein SugA [Streptomyces sp. MH192]MCF0097769.1 Trehalose transport system permease protein SugA [Streptomyces sp. MH191]
MAVAGHTERRTAEEPGNDRRRPSRKGRAPRRGARRPGEARTAYLLIAPAVLLLALVVGYPVLKAVYQSFLTDPGLDRATGMFDSGGNWFGLHNYTHWLLQRCATPEGGWTSCPSGALGSQFWGSVGVTVGFTVVACTLETVIGMVFALTMHRAFRGRAMVRVAILVPWAIPTAVTSKLWQVMFDPQGVVNKLLGTHYAWTSSLWPARSAIVVADTWKTTPFIALLILAGLQNIPAETYEAARIDGAGAWRRFTNVTLPLVKPALAVAVVFRALDTLRMYDLPKILTGGSNGTTTSSVLVVNQLTRGANSASALSTITFVLIFVIAFGLVRLLNANLFGAPAKAVS